MPGPQAWIGREQRARDLLDEPLARRWLATFDLAQPAAGAVPQGIHWCLCVPDAPTAALGPDGHPMRADAPDSFLPPVAAPRRMWAGSACEFLAPLGTGARVERVSRIEAVAEKQGASGPLTFVTILHETAADGMLAVRERQTLVYRAAPPPDSPPAPPPPGETRFDEAGWDAVERVTPSMALLFRYSALTFNTHRIHYDADYVRAVESYRGPVVHGPLMGSLLLQLAARRFGDNALTRFAFRALSPAVADEPLVLALRGAGDAIELDGRRELRMARPLAGAVAS